LVVAHGNSLRALHMILKSLTPEQVVALELATGAPSIYEFTTSFEKPNCLL
jgi:2,3-bisphosphoglycerate-dependent phosphoglycerate mutase